MSSCRLAGTGSQEELTAPWGCKICEVGNFASFKNTRLFKIFVIRIGNRHSYVVCILWVELLKLMDSNVNSRTGSSWTRDQSSSWNQTCTVVSIPLVWVVVSTGDRKKQCNRRNMDMRARGSRKHGDTPPLPLPSSYLGSEILPHLWYDTSRSICIILMVGTSICLPYELHWV